MLISTPRRLLARASSDDSALSRHTTTGSSDSTERSIVTTSTPPTSHAETSSIASDAQMEEKRPETGRSLRSRQSIPTYNVKILAGTAVHTRKSYLAKDASRDTPGGTLEGEGAEQAGPQGEAEEIPDSAWEDVDDDPKGPPEAKAAAARYPVRGRLRARATNLTYNIKILAGTAIHTRKGYLAADGIDRQAGGTPARRRRAHKELQNKPGDITPGAPRGDLDDDIPNGSPRRGLRNRPVVGTYNLKILAGTAVHTPRRYLDKDNEVPRDASRETPVGEASTPELLSWDVDAIPGDPPMDRVAALRRRRSSRLGLIAAEEVARKGEAVASSLGKRGREAWVSGKDTLRGLVGSRRFSFRSRDASSKEENEEEPAPKRTRLSSAAQESPAPVDTETPQDGRPHSKRWLTQGLYVGQHQSFDPRLTGSKNKVNRKFKHRVRSPRERKYLPLPMFKGRLLLEEDVYRPFKLPFDVFNPLPREERPEDWRRMTKNRFVGDAVNLWKKEHLDSSQCHCVPARGCDENCLNRSMMYECDHLNCNLGPNCGNRAFAELKKRVNSKNKFDFGVEVTATEDRGYGVRAMRPFVKDQIITEYTGEIITQDEADRRMNNEYKRNEDYYMMTFGRGMIIDATKGSIARFVNHSCEPNCRMVKWTVSGEPRMALFADRDIMTGEELTYDYNFESFSQKSVQRCLCGAPSCRGEIRPKTREDSKPKDGQPANNKRKADTLGDDGPRSRKRKLVAFTKSIAKFGRATQTKTIAAVVDDKAAQRTREAEQSKSREERARRRQGFARRATLRRKAVMQRSTGALKRITTAIKTRTYGTRRGLPPSTPQPTRSNPKLSLPDFDPLGLKFETEDEDESGPKLGKGPAASPGRPQTATSMARSVRRNVVRSVRGTRRAAAMAKYGIKDAIESGSTIRCILSDEE